MRRSHTLNARHTTRPSIITSGDDLTALRENEESTEATLRRQLLEKEKDNDKLQDQILQLQAQLAQRPPLEAVLELKKEYTNLEILLQGTQRENERCMAELERAKQREKALEKELERLAGANWQANLDIMSSRAVFSVANPSHARQGSTSTSLPTGSATDAPADTSAEKEANKTYIEQARLLIIGMEQRLQDREERLLKNIERAEAEGKRFEDARKHIITGT